MTLDLVEQKQTAQAALERAAKAAPGLHLIGDFYDVACGERVLTDAATLREKCVRLVRESGLSIAGDYFHQFGEGGGVTGMVVLMESHMSVHTWPEKGFVTVDVYVCNYSSNNRPKAQKLFDDLISLFEPRSPRIVSVDRP
jgi:S-adenosylmethionine decarboxylase